MKKLSLVSLLALCLSLPLSAAAAVPGTLAFTARIADNGRPVTGSHTVKFTIWDCDGSNPGTCVDPTNVLWAETQPLTVTDGVLSAVLGADAANLLPLGIFNGAPMFVEVTFDGTAFTPRMPVHSVPYAFHAAVADSAAVANSVPFTGITGRTGNLVASINANRDGVANAAGFVGMITHTPTVNVRAQVIARCSFDGSAAGQLLAFRAAIRSPPTTGPVSPGAAYEQASQTPGPNLWVANAAVDSFLLNAGQAYELGMNFLVTPTGGFNNDFCSLFLQTFER